MVFIKTFVALGLASLATLASAIGPGGPPPTFDHSAVLDLIPDNFDKIAIGGKPALVEFFAPWCGHCKSLAPVYEQLAQEFAFAKDKLVIAKVDADSEKSLGKRFGVQGFPTIKFFDGKSEKPEDYSGGRDLESLSEFLTKKTGIKPKKPKAAPSDVTWLTDATWKSHVGKDQDVLVAFTAPWCGHCKNLAPIWEKLATDFANEPSVLVAKVDADNDNSKFTAKEYGVTSYPTILFFPKGKTESESYLGGRNENEFVQFLNTHAGTNRMAGGGLNANAGTIETLDTLVSKFVSGTGVAELAAEATKAAADLKEGAQYKYAQYYVRVFDKLSKSDGYAAKELARLEKMIKKGGLAPSKLDDFTSKTNILRRFIAEKVTGKSEL
jgi:protein disulfide-isomerase A6